MINDLITKLLAWTPDLANQFHENISRSGNNSNKIWEVVDDGCYVASADSVVFYNNSGTSYHLQHGILTENLQLINQLSTLAEQQNLIRFACPNNIQEIVIHGTEFTYWEETLPYASHGIDFTTLLLVDQSQKPNITFEFLKNLVVGLDQLIYLLDNISNDKKLYPWEIQSSNFYYDVNSNNYFWRNNFLLTESRQGSINSIESSIGVLDSYLQSWLKISIPNFTKEIQNHIKEKCTILNLAI
jgi:hypothetical protein